MGEMAAEGTPITISKACEIDGLSRRSYYYQPRQRSPTVGEWLARRIEGVIEALPYAGYRTGAWLLGDNKHTVQRVFQIKGWQVRKRRKGFRLRVQALPSITSRPNERWATDRTRVWCGERDR